MRALPYNIQWVLRFLLAVVMSFLLFTAVALLHAVFGIGGHATEVKQARRIVAAETVRKEPPEKKAAQQRIRQIQQSASGGKSQQGQMAMRFAPDLSLDVASEGGAAIEASSSEMEAEVFEQGETDEEALPEYTPEIPYPERGREQGITGDVEAIFVINHLGRPADIQIVRAPAPFFAAEVRRGIANWRFKPAKNKGIPVNVRVRQVLSFQLD